MQTCIWFNWFGLVFQKICTHVIKNIPIAPTYYLLIEDQKYKNLFFNFGLVQKTKPNHKNHNFWFGLKWFGFCGFSWFFIGFHNFERRNRFFSFVYDRK